MAAFLFIASICAAALAARWIAPAPYEFQDRDAIAQPCSKAHPLGTDDLGRDRLARLLEGMRVSLLLAPAAALIAVAIGSVAGVWAGLQGGLWERALDGVSNLFLCMPWIFLLITVRAALPLDTTPWMSVTVTFVLLGIVGWAGPVRVIRAAARSLATSDFLLAAHAFGSRPARIAFVQLLPNLRPVLAAQFWTSVPLFLLAEANLTFLGLGVMEPLPSWGSMLKELENADALRANPAIAVPALLLAAFVASLHLVIPQVKGRLT